jgi:4-hydroxy-3-methylbut-2-enyl diphosphate reductase
MTETKKVWLAKPRGFCAGVRAALDTVNSALRCGGPLYVLHEIVHNDFVVGELRGRGAVFIESLEQAPPGARLAFSAHGVSAAVEAEAAKRGLIVTDATCPRVKKTHRKAARLEEEGRFIVVIGNNKHPETAGIVGRLKNLCAVIESPADIERLAQTQGLAGRKAACITQSTLSADDVRDTVERLRRIFTDITGGSDICRATQNRQNAIKLVAERADVTFVIGSPKSSNSNRLREVAEKSGKPAFLLNSAADLRDSMLAGALSAGVSAGASAPESLVQDLLDALKSKGFTDITEVSAPGGGDE